MGVSMVFQNVLDVVLDVVFYGVAVVQWYIKFQWCGDTLGSRMWVGDT